MNARSLKTAGTTAVALLGLAATSYGYLGATGQGTGSGSASVAPAITIGAGSAPSATLLPTGPSVPTGTLSVSLQNTTGAAVHVDKLVLDAMSQAAQTCGLTFVEQTNGGQGWAVAANSTRTLELTKSVAMPTTAGAACEYETFTIYLKTA